MLLVPLIPVFVSVVTCPSAQENELNTAPSRFRATLQQLARRNIMQLIAAALGAAFAYVSHTYDLPMWL
ncbi:hypothetical protein RO07_08705 [Pandoraea pulmonicola]|uniref:Uncharacterized protein n=1 Tax=Pandoraea pulmonicola TaxID=93221 RepID=A0ABM5RYH4_PANPU|nr:hypothetical protein RO07_08705 [Pandoraea pulmonicola]